MVAVTDWIGDGRLGAALRVAVRRPAILLVVLGLALTVLASARPALSGPWGRFGPGPWVGPGRVPAPVAVFPGALPYGSRFYYPPGVPLSYSEPGSGTTYCLSQTGFYYLCGYDRPAPEPIGFPYYMPPGAVPPYGEPGLSPPSGVLLFKLPQDAEVTVNGVPVDLSGGLGIAAVTPGRYRVVVRSSGKVTEHEVTVNPRAIFTVTPTAIVPTGP